MPKLSLGPDKKVTLQGWKGGKEEGKKKRAKKKEKKKKKKLGEENKSGLL